MGLWGFFTRTALAGITRLVRSIRVNLYSNMVLSKDIIMVCVGFWSATLGQTAGLIGLKSVPAGSSMCFTLLPCPRFIVTRDLAIPSSFAKKLISSMLALPSIGGDLISITTVPASIQPDIFVCLEFGRTLTVSIILWILHFPNNSTRHLDCPFRGLAVSGFRTKHNGWSAVQTGVCHI